MREPLSTVYHVTCPRCKVLVEGEWVQRELFAKWVEHRLDSSELRAEVLQRLESRTGARLASGATIELHAVLPARFAGETEIEIRKPLPSGRARVVLTFEVRNQEEIDWCFGFEQRLEKALDARGVGFVDGNDIGQGEFRIFCYGPRKAPLKAAVLSATTDVRLSLRLD